MKEIYYKGDDLKLSLKMMLDGNVISPRSVPWEIHLWTNRKSDRLSCGWNGTAFYGGASDDGNLIRINADANSKWWHGVLHSECVITYVDAQMPDNNYTVIADIDWCSDTSGVITHTVYGLSAYQVAVQNGFVGTEQEWIQSLNAKIQSQAYDAAGNTIITWKDGMQTTIKRGIQGKSAYEIAVELGYEGTIEQWNARTDVLIAETEEKVDAYLAGVMHTWTQSEWAAATEAQKLAYSLNIVVADDPTPAVTPSSYDATTGVITLASDSAYNESTSIVTLGENSTYDSNTGLITLY